MRGRAAWLTGILVTAVCASAQVMILLPFRHTVINTGKDAAIVAGAMGSSLWATLALGYGVWAFSRLQGGRELKRFEAPLWWALGVAPTVLGGAACLVLILAWLG